MSPLMAKCDICGATVKHNVAERPITAVRGKLTVRVEVVKANGSAPIICAHCVQLAAMHGELHQEVTA